MRRGLILLIIFFASIVMGCGAQEEFIATGTIQGKEVILTAQVPAKVEKILVSEGQNVRAGEQLALLEDVELRLNLAQAEAALELAQAQLIELAKGARVEDINKAKASQEQIEANIAVIQASLDNVLHNLTQQEKLFKAGALSQNQLDQLVTQRKVLENQIIATQKQRDAAYWQLVSLENGPSEEAIQRLEAQVKINKINIELAEHRLSQTIIKSPINGSINILSGVEGENVIIGKPFVSIVDPQDLWIRVYIPENEMAKIALGQEVRVKTSSYPEKRFQGKVSNIAHQAQFTPRNVQTKDQRTTMVFPITITLLEGFEVLKVGLPVDVYFTNLEKGER